MPTLAELQALESQQGKAQLQTLLLKFTGTLTRLPSLQNELKGWLTQDAQAVDYTSFVAEAESALIAATQWFLRYDRLSHDVQQHPRLIAYQEYLTKRATVITLTDLLRLSEEEEKIAFKEAEAERKRIAQQKATEAEAERKRIEQQKVVVNLIMF